MTQNANQFEQIVEIRHAEVAKLFQDKEIPLGVAEALDIIAPFQDEDRLLQEMGYSIINGSRATGFALVFDTTFFVVSPIDPGQPISPDQCGQLATAITGQAMQALPLLSEIAHYEEGKRGSVYPLEPPQAAEVAERLSAEGFGLIDRSGEASFALVFDGLVLPLQSIELHRLPQSLEETQALAEYSNDLARRIFHAVLTILKPV